MLEIITTLKDFLEYRNSMQGMIGLVPTMGNLHEGHLSLLKESLKENDQTIITIFVNPKQFGQGEDLDKYPRTFEEDLNKIKNCMDENNHVVIFHPANDQEIYGVDFNTTVKVDVMKGILCDKFRPGHFDGVTTVVYRLFALCKPDHAYFGQKDYQQFKIIEKMTQDLLLPITLKMMPITRDQDGLALSSRNRYLDQNQKEVALILTRTLSNLEIDLNEMGLETSLEKANTIKKGNSGWQYLEILDAENLLPLSKNSKMAVIAGAFVLSSTRLIDNRLVTLKHVK